MTKSLITREYVYVSNDKGIVVDCAGCKQVRLIIQVD